MSLLTPATSKIITQAFVEHCCRAYRMDHNGFHGFNHWMRVLNNGRMLADAEGANLKVVELFCLSTTPSVAMSEETPLTAVERPAMHSLSGVFGSTYLTKR